MAENQETPPSVIENLALVTDAIQTMFPEGKIICVYELKDQDFKKVQNNFRSIDSQHKRFSIDMSGLEHVFIHEELGKMSMDFEETPKIEEPKVKKTTISKILSWFVSRRGSVK